MPLQLPRPLGERIEVRGDLNPQLEFPASPRLLVAASEPLLLAQAVQDLPTAADLSETPEVQFTQDIRNLATQLGNKPTKIFEWVRNNIEFVPSYGSIQGADMCLQSRQCNAMDTASLLIALLRVSNFPARYAYGTVEVPVEKIMNWVGGFTDPKAALTLMASGGVPVAAGISGGVITKARLEHVWVETYIPYGNYRGAILDDSIKTWIPMDGSFKQYTYTNGFDITGAVPFSQDTYLSQVQSQNAVHYYQSQIQQYLDANMPDTSIVDVKGYREITQETYHFLPSTLPYKPVALLGTFSATPANMAAKVTFTLTDSTTGSAVSFTASTPELTGKRITFSYIPATASDETLIAAHGGYLYDVPAYMLNLKPVLRIEGDIKLTGEAASMGSDETLSIQFSQPNGMNEAIQKKLVTGTFYAVGMDLQGVNENVLGKRNASLTANVLSESAGTLGSDDLVGEFLFIRAINYFLANDKIYKSGAKLYNVVTTRTISEAITSFPLAVTTVFSVPKSVKPAGAEMDVAMDRIITVAKDGNTIKEKAYMDIAGLVSSYHEHDIWEKIDQFAAASAVKAIQTATVNNIPVYTINAMNISQFLPTLQVTAEVKKDVQNAVNAGKEVMIPQTNIQIEDWLGVGYIVKDPATGSGTYRITGGLNGAFTVALVVGVVIAGFIAGPLVWVLAVLFLMMGNTIAEAAELNIGEKIVETSQAIDASTMGYEDVGQCSGLVRVAYWSAGICLDNTEPPVGFKCSNSLMEKHKINAGTGGATGGAARHHALADHIKFNKSVRTTNDPLVGDIVFFSNTTGPNRPYNHEGIVVSLPDTKGKVRFIHGSSKAGIYAANLNVSRPEDLSQNNVIGCFCGEECTCSGDDCIPCLAGKLSKGFGTVRDVPCSDSSHK
jgi:transglutaminase-like putative cysteine protease